MQSSVSRRMTTSPVAGSAQRGPGALRCHAAVALSPGGENDIVNPEKIKQQPLRRVTAVDGKRKRIDEIDAFGGDNRTRICDLPRVRRTLYRLSYASIFGR